VLVVKEPDQTVPLPTLKFPYSLEDLPLEEETNITESKAFFE
jgi:hypothetical protein